jgi:hypothetical protein
VSVQRNQIRMKESRTKDDAADERDRIPVHVSETAKIFAAAMQLYETSRLRYSQPHIPMATSLYKFESSKPALL